MKPQTCYTETHGHLTQLPNRYIFTKEELKEFSTAWFRWWFNEKGGNTDKGFDEYMKRKGL